MAYRNIEVDGKKYQYVIGKIHVKIKGLGLYPLEQAGNKMPVDNHNDKYIVTPKTIALIIKGEPTPNPDFCYAHGMTEKAVPDLYSTEIDNEDIIIHACPKCVHIMDMSI